jgi:DnaK suppressor protein
MASTLDRMRDADRTGHGKLESLLSSQRTVLRSRMQILRSGPSTETSGVLDDEEHSLDAEEQGVGFSVLELMSHTVQGLETALRRLGAGELGLCSDCRQKISGARLRALPFTDVCLACQAERDIAAATVASRAAAGWRERVVSTRIGATGA